ncbi:MAG: hypothetical protein ABH849_03065 [Nanoarchaeota archaeon]
MDSSLFAGFLTIIVGLIISAIPLFIAIKFLGGKVSLVKVIVINLLAGIISILIILFLIPLLSSLSGWLLTIIPYIPYIILILIYSVFFQLGIIKATIAWILQAIILYILNLLSNSLLGISIF